jgi:hypothetical protein
MASFAQDKKELDMANEPLPADTTLGTEETADQSWREKLAYLKWCFTTKEGWFGDYVSYCTANTRAIFLA